MTASPITLALTTNQVFGQTGLDKQFRPREDCSLIRVYAVCIQSALSGCISLRYFSMVNPQCSYFKIISIMFLNFRTDRSVQTDPRAVWSGSTLFAIPSASSWCISLRLNHFVQMLGLQQMFQVSELLGFVWYINFSVSKIFWFYCTHVILETQSLPCC